MINLKSKRTIFCVCLFVLYVLINLYTVQYSRLTWFDECYMADYTHNLITNGHLQNTTRPCVSEHCVYGPVYFLLTGVITYIAGFYPFTFRLLNLMCFFGCAIVMIHIMRIRKVDNKIITLSSAIYLLDILNLRNSDSGRMEFVALLFVLLAYYLFFKYKEQNISSIIVSILLTLALLTTPRVAVIVLPIAIWLLYRLIKTHDWKVIVLYIAIPVGSYISWIIFDYGSIYSFVDYLFNAKNGGPNPNSSSVSNFVGGNFSVEWYHIPLLILYAFTLIYSLISKIHNAKWLYVFPVILFFVLVNDTGMYGVYFLPFVFLFIAETNIKSDKKYLSRIVKYAAILMLLINSSAYIFKLTTTLSSISQRDEIQSERYIASVIPEGSIVISDYAHYYAVVNNNCVFKTERLEGKSYQCSINELKMKCKPEYIVIGNNETKANETYMNNFKCKLIGQYKTTSSENTLYDIIRKIGSERLNTFLDLSYSCNIYEIE